MNSKDLTVKTSFTDWMNKGFVGKYNDKNPEMSLQMTKPLLLANGVILSVQASQYHYSFPRVNAPVPDYDFYKEFELGFPTQKLPEEFTEYADDADHLTDTVYAYVPKKMLQEYIDSVGGVVGFGVLSEDEQPTQILPNTTNLDLIEGA